LLGSGGLGSAPLVDCESESTKEKHAKDGEDDDPDPVVILVIRSWIYGLEWISALWQNFITDISVVKCVVACI